MRLEGSTAYTRFAVLTGLSIAGLGVGIALRGLARGWPALTVGAWASVFAMALALGFQNITPQKPALVTKTPRRQ